MVKVPVVDPGRDQRVALEVDRLTVVGGRDAHVADRHVRKTSPREFPRSLASRRGLSRRQRRIGKGQAGSLKKGVGKHVFGVRDTAPDA